MVLTISLNYHTLFKTDEIYNRASHRLLPVEMMTQLTGS